MRYFIFKRSVEGSEIGDVPQAMLSGTKNPNGPRGAYKVKPFEFPNFVPEIDLELTKKAKWTDIMSAIGPSPGYVINFKTKKALENLRLPESAFYPLEIKSKNETRNYFWFHFINNDFWDWVDKERSKLYLRSIIPDHRSKVLAEADLSLSKEELKDLAGSKPRLTDYYWEKLVFNEKFPDLDIFSTLFPARKTIVNERLLNTFRDAGITGYEVKPFKVVLV